MNELNDLEVLKQKLIDPPPEDCHDSVINCNSCQRDILALKFISNDYQYIISHDPLSMKNYKL